MDEGLKYLHVYDDDKVTETSIRLYQNLKEFYQKFIILTENINKWTHLVNEFDSVQTMAIDKSTIANIDRYVREFDVIYFHPLSYLKAKFLAYYKGGKKIFVWVLWGYELYGFVDYYIQNDNYKTSISDRRFLSKVKNFYSYSIVYKRAIKKIDVCYFLIEEDYKLLKSTFPCKAVWFSNVYPTLEYYLKDIPLNHEKGETILIGNSATPSNLHKSVFKKLGSIHNRKLLCPLNYGDEKYSKEIIELGHEKYGDNFLGLSDFLPLELYLKELSNCSHAIMPHERQQAFGTIVIMLCLGVKVFVSEKSNVYIWLLNNGFKVYSFEKELLKEIVEPLIESISIKNIEVLSKLFSEDEVLKKEISIRAKIELLWESKEN